MARSKSWRKIARPIIAEVLLKAPADATEHQLRAALRAVYPFGIREHHPYKIWLDECRKQLAFHLGQKAQSTAPALRFRFCHGKKPFWIDVQCGWCNSRKPLGCMLCLSRHQALIAVLADAAFQGQLTCLRQQPTADGAHVLGDWLEEHGEYELADLFHAVNGNDIDWI